MLADLLKILVCPLCKTRVELTADGAGLDCKDCRRRYPVRDGIPVMLPEEAVIVKEAKRERDCPSDYEKNT